MKRITAEEAKNLSNSFPSKADKNEVLGRWFKNEMTTEEIIDMANDTISKMEGWIDNWKIVLETHKGIKDNESKLQVFNYCKKKGISPKIMQTEFEEWKRKQN